MASRSVSHQYDRHPFDRVLKRRRRLKQLAAAAHDLAPVEVRMDKCHTVHAGPFHARMLVAQTLQDPQDFAACRPEAPPRVGDEQIRGCSVMAKR
jgi:hypothetical protein